MPSKRKTKKSTKKKPEKTGLVVAGENDLEAKYRRSILDIAILQDRVALQCESVTTVQSDRVDLRRRMRDMEQKLQHERQDHRDVNSDLPQEVLVKEKKEREQVAKEKDSIITDQQNKLDNMETDYERILQTLDSLTSQLSADLRGRIKDKSSMLPQNYKELLSGIGLNALDI